MSAQGAFKIERVLPASAEEVFAAWTSPERMAAWMSPEGRAEAEVDLRPGGAFRVAMVGTDLRIEHTGTYVELDPPYRLAFTWISPYTGPEPSLVTVELHPHGDGTRLVLVHERLPAGAVDSHRSGWGAMFERLADALAA